MMNYRIVFFVILFIVLIHKGAFYPISTRYITDYKFNNIEQYEFSNISFVENGGIELARDYKVLYSGKNAIWVLAAWKGGLLAGTGDPAHLVYLNGGVQKKVLDLPDQVLISDIKQIRGLLYVSSLPRGLITVLDDSLILKKSITFKSEYIWNIVPDSRGYFVLTGNPALLYHFNFSNEPDIVIPVTNEDNLLKGISDGEDLYFTADGNVLYKFSWHDKKIRPVYSFDNPIMDIYYISGLIYIITSVAETKTQAREVSSDTTQSDENATAAKQSEKKSTHAGVFKSGLYSFDLKWSIEKIYEKSNIRFISLSYWNNSIIIGTDKNAGFYQISLKGNERRFSGLGIGKFARLLGINGENYALLLEPSRIIKLNREFSGTGWLISGSFDTGGISRWGRLIIDGTVNQGTSLKVFTRSGAIPEDGLWDEWAEYSNTAGSEPNRYFQYKVEFMSDGNKTPVFNGIIVPFVQKNSAPRIEKITINYNNSIYKLSWDAQSDDKDVLIYNLYLALEGGRWVKINDKPIEENNFDLNPANYPEGHYRLKVTASDERSNTPEDSKEGYKISDPFMIVNSSPVIGDIAIKKNGKTAELSWKVTDDLSPILEVDYMVSGLKWLKILPVSGIYDSTNLTFGLKLNIDEPEFIVIKASDIYGNYSTKGIFVDQ